MLIELLIGILFLFLLYLVFSPRSNKKNSAIKKLNDAYYTFIKSALNIKDKDTFITEFEKSFGDNITKINECILKNLKEQNITETQIANMNSTDLMKILNSNFDIMEKCTKDNQIEFIFTVISICQIEYNKLFNYVKTNIDQSQTTEQITSKLNQFLVDNGCCPEGLKKCGSTCIDNNSSCNVCVPECSSSQTCNDGVCVPNCNPGSTLVNGVCVPSTTICGTGLTHCNGTCVNTLSNDNYCGNCETKCGTNQSCMEGKCMDSVIGCNPGYTLVNGECVPNTVPTGCGSGLTKCGSLCVDIKSNPTYCGNCNTACGANQTCTDGSCICSSGYMLQNGACVQPSTTTCGPGLTDCNRKCVDISSDPSYCGNCNTACGATQQCISGSCQCLPGYNLCGTQCISINDAANCGSCGTICPLGSSCQNGSCQTDITQFSIYPTSGYTRIILPKTIFNPSPDRQTYTIQLISVSTTPSWAQLGQKFISVNSTIFNSEIVELDYILPMGTNRCTFAIFDNSGNPEPVTLNLYGMPKYIDFDLWTPAPGPCQKGLTYCKDSNTCVNLLNDVSNCGDCDFKCIIGKQTCTNGKCTEMQLPKMS